MRTPGKPRKPRPLTGNVSPQRTSGGEAKQTDFLDTSQDSVPTAFVDPLDIDDHNDYYDDDEYIDDADYDDDDDVDDDFYDDELDSQTRNPFRKIASGAGSRWTALKRKLRRKSADETLEDDEDEDFDFISPVELSDRRRERAAEKRRIRLKRILRGVGIVFGVLVFLWIFFFSSLLRYEYHDSDISGVTETSIIDKQKLAAALRGFNGYHILLLDDDELNATVKKEVPEVASISSEYRFPNSLSFTVVAQKPAACIVNESGCQAIAYDGTQIEIPEDQIAALPHIAQFSEKTDPKRSVTAIMDILSVVPDDIHALISKVAIDDHAMVTLSLTDGRTVRWGANEENDRKVKILQALLTQTQRVIDISAPGAPVTSN